MKKILIALLCAAMAMVFVACGEDNKQTPTSATQAATQKPTIWNPTQKPTTPSQGATLVPNPTYAQTPSQASPDNGSQSALETARMYLNDGTYSYQTLVQALQNAGFSYDDAVYAADNCGADWENEAWNAASENAGYYISTYNEMVEFLQGMGFTYEQAIYGASKVYPDSHSEDDGGDVMAAANDYVSRFAISRSDLVSRLMNDGYSYDEAEDAASNCGADWYSEAVEAGAQELIYDTYSHDGLVSRLMNLGFTNAQAEYGATQNGV